LALYEDVGSWPEWDARAALTTREVLAALYPRGSFLAGLAALSDPAARHRP
jgi:hypothetical protein